MDDNLSSAARARIPETRPDVLIAGGGPAGCIAGIVLARAGARVTLVDRATFPRPKLCGDTVNPGAMAILARLGLDEYVQRAGLPIDGMAVSGENGMRVEGRYGRGRGFAIQRRELDQHLLECAARAGVRIEQNVTVVGALVDGRATKRTVLGLRVRDASRRPRSLAARVTVAADGRRSTLAFGLGLARHPARHRRYALGAYYEGVGGLASLGEMHVRSRWYVGLAPLPGGLTNVCLVLPLDMMRAGRRTPRGWLERTIAAEPALAGRFAAARMVGAPTVLGPLAIEASSAGLPGLVLAGDAAGFIDPMTGDGLRFALRGGELAARAALLALDGTRDAYRILRRWRAREFSRKLAFNRALRTLVGSPTAVRAAGTAVAFAPAILRRTIVIAGDVPSSAACA